MVFQLSSIVTFRTYPSFISKGTCRHTSKLSAAPPTPSSLALQFLRLFHFLFQTYATLFNTFSILVCPIGGGRLLRVIVPFFFFYTCWRITFLLSDPVSHTFSLSGLDEYVQHPFESQLAHHVTWKYYYHEIQESRQAGARNVCIVLTNQPDTLLPYREMYQGSGLVCTDGSWSCYTPLGLWYRLCS